MQLTGGQHFDDSHHARATLLGKVVPGVDRELPHRRRVLAQPQRLLQIELGLSTEPTVKDEHPARRQQSDVVRNTGSCDGIDDGINTPVSGDLPDPLPDFLGFAVDDVIRPDVAGKARLFLAADHAVNNKVRCFRQVDERVPHAASSGVDEHSLTLPRSHGIGEDVIGDLIIGERSCGIKIDIVGQKKLASVGVATYSA